VKPEHLFDWYPLEKVVGIKPEHDPIDMGNNRYIFGPREWVVRYEYGDRRRPGRFVIPHVVVREMLNEHDSIFEFDSIETEAEALNRLRDELNAAAERAAERCDDHRDPS
jgi:hypothetical protein